MPSTEQILSPLSGSLRNSCRTAHARRETYRSHYGALTRAEWGRREAAPLGERQRDNAARGSQGGAERGESRRSAAWARPPLMRILNTHPGHAHHRGPVPGRVPVPGGATSGVGRRLRTKAPACPTVLAGGAAGHHNAPPAPAISNAAARRPGQRGLGPGAGPAGQAGRPPRTDSGPRIQAHPARAERNRLAPPGRIHQSGDRRWTWG